MLKSKGYIPIKKFNQTQLQDHKPKVNNHNNTLPHTETHNTKPQKAQKGYPPITTSTKILLRCGYILSDVRVGLFDVGLGSHQYRSLSVSYHNSLANMTLSLPLSLFLCADGFLFFYFAPKTKNHHIT